MLPAGHHLYVAGRLSVAIPPEQLLQLLMFPDRESSILPHDDSLRKHPHFDSLSVGIATLNLRLYRDYPLTGKSCRFSVVGTKQLLNL